MTARAARLVLILLVLGVAACDQGSKHWAEHDLQGKPPSSIVRDRLDLEYTRNPGVAFSLERHLPEGARTPLVLISGLGLLTLLGIAAWKRRDQLTAQSAGYALVIGGAIGNLSDRLTRGYVVDFVHVHGWPIFNVADCAVAVGVGLLMLASLRPAAT